MRYFCKRICIYLVIAVLTIFLIPNFACAKVFDNFGMICFNTDVYVLVEDKKLDQKVKQEMQSVLESLEQEFSLSSEFSATSFTQAFNNSGDTVSLAGFTYATEIINECKKINLLTNKFNPAIYPLLDLWQLSSNRFVVTNPNFIPPKDSEILSLLSFADFDSLTLDLKNQVIVKNYAQTKIDLGGVIKGYASQKLSEILLNNGYTKGYVNIGGSSLNILHTEYDLSIIHPRGNESLSQYIINVKADKVNQKSISTSGDYVRYYIYEGVRYCHVIDASNGKPVDSGFSSVTVIGDDGLFCDAISTALMCMQKQDFINFVKSNLTDYQVYAVYENSNEKQILTNKKQGEYFTLLDGNYAVVNF